MASKWHHGLIAIPFDTGEQVMWLYVNSIGTSCIEAIQSIIMQLFNQGGTVEKIIKKHVIIDIFQDLA